MARLVLLWPTGSVVRFGEAEAGQLATLGVTRLGLVRGDRMIGVVVDGWAFDPARSGDGAAGILSPETPVDRLFPRAEVGVSNATVKGEAG